MSFFYCIDGRPWHLWTDNDGAVHDEPVTDPEPQSLESVGEWE